MPPVDAAARIWTIIIPVKETSVAKTRLRHYSVEQRAALAVAFAMDAAAAAARCPFVRRVVAVSNDEPARERLATLGVTLVPDLPAAGINPALSYACQTVRSSDPSTAVAAMSADLPALRTEALTKAVRRAASTPRWFVPDLPGAGTTLLAARCGQALQPKFGRDSAALHRASGAVRIDGDDLERLRRDVDTEADLQAALALGVGPHTSAAVTRIGLAAARP